MIDKKSGVAGDAETSWERRDRLNREARDIVRRLAELGTIGDKALMYQLWEDAARLWAKMQREVGDGE